ncbi:DUF7525 family protein [Halorussus halophilus]|uniref:DUF7525 family protein n=1 Tax=Halorussus halophilus TaxID=2650975 RepID=UPI001300D9A0|nr:hypothetical protein [Halorussus halophilus]
MAEHQSVGTDKGIGLASLFTLLAGVGAAAMFLAPGEEIAAWGFAGAVAAGVFAVAAVHLFWK